MHRCVIAAAVMLAATATAPAAQKAASPQLPPEACTEELYKCIGNCGANMSCHRWCEDYFAPCMGDGRAGAALMGRKGPPSAGPGVLEQTPSAVPRRSIPMGTFPLGRPASGDQQVK